MVSMKKRINSLGSWKTFLNSTNKMTSKKKRRLYQKLRTRLLLMRKKKRFLMVILRKRRLNLMKLTLRNSRAS